MTVRKEEEIRRNPNWKRSKFSLFAGDMILYIENPKDATRKLLQLINESQDIKLTHRNSLHFYTLTMKNQKEKLKK